MSAPQHAGTVRAEVEFWVKPDSVETLQRKAFEIDSTGEMGNDPLNSPEEYTLPQALQVVWVYDPAWLHDNILHGWTLETADADGNGMTRVWS